MVQKTFNGRTFQHKVIVDDEHCIYFTQEVYSFYLGRQQTIKPGSHSLSKKIIEREAETLLDEFNVLDYKEMFLSTEKDGSWVVEFVTADGEYIKGE